MSIDPSAPPLVVSYSEIDTYRQCPLKWQLAYQERWTKPTPPGSARDKGTLWHSVLEAHYSAIKAEQDAAADADPKNEDAWTRWDPELAAKRAQTEVTGLLRGPSGELLGEIHELIEWMYVGYLEHYGWDRDWRVLGTETRDEVPLYRVDVLTGALTPTRYRLKTRIDAVIRDYGLGGRLWVVDHKSGKDLPRNKALDIDDQFGLYTLAQRRTGRQVFGQLYNAARTQRNKTGGQTLESRFARYRLYREDAELLAIEADAVKTLDKAYTHVGGDHPASPNPDSCTWKCDFLEPHIQARKQGRSPSEIVADWGFEQDYTRH